MVAAIAIVLIATLRPIGLAIGGALLGFIAAFLMVGWMIAFDIRALPWLWGVWGEEETGEELSKLDSSWHVTHDIPNSHGNWDHVVVGPAGLFVIDSKRLNGRIAVSNDGISAGRTRFQGSTFRGASFGLHAALRARVTGCPWVQAVVAIWGDFPEQLRVEENVVYIAGAGLVDWLINRETSLDARRCASLAEAIRSLRSDTAQRPLLMGRSQGDIV